MSANYLDHLMQAAIACTGLIALVLLTRRPQLTRWRGKLVARRPAYARWGHVIGLAGQPFWLLSAASHQQWGMFAVSLVYTLVFAEGIYVEFFRREDHV